MRGEMAESKLSPKQQNTNVRTLLKWLLAGQLLALPLVLSQWWEIYSASLSLTDYFQRTTDVHFGLTNVSAEYWTETGKIPAQISTIYLLILILILITSIVLTARSLKRLNK